MIEYKYNKPLHEGDFKMTKRERLENQMYKEIAKGNFDKADKIRRQIVDLDVATLNARLNKR